MPHLVRDLLPGLDVVAVRFKASHVQCTASAQGLRRWQFDVREEDGGLDARGKCRVLDDTQSSLGDAV